MPRVRPGFMPVVAVRDRVGEPVDLPPRFRVEYDWVRIDPETPLWFDENGNAFSDERRLKPAGMTLVRLHSVPVEAENG
jgi:hypothetical protein